MEEGPAPKYVQVPIPEDLVEDVFAFVTARRREQAAEGAATPDGDRGAAPHLHPESPEADRDTESQEDTWDAESLREFLDHANGQLVDLLVYLAKQAPEAVPAEEAIVAAGLTPGRSAGGFLSRAGRSAQYHFGRDLPLGKDWNGERGRYDYWVSREHANVILRHADG